MLRGGMLRGGVLRQGVLPQGVLRRGSLRRGMLLESARHGMRFIAGIGNPVLSVEAG
jgi:hypothetical protein